MLKREGREAKRKGCIENSMSDRDRKDRRMVEVA